MTSCFFFITAAMLAGISSADRSQSTKEAVALVVDADTVVGTSTKTVPELRLCPQSTQLLYTKAQFLGKFHSPTVADLNWNSAPQEVRKWKRSFYTLEQFEEYPTGQKDWQDAELRHGQDDQVPYTKAEFDAWGRGRSMAGSAIDVIWQNSGRGSYVHAKGSPTAQWAFLETRRAPDGKCYSFQEFVDFFGANYAPLWQQAVPCNQDQKAPPAGYKTVAVAPVVVKIVATPAPVPAPAPAPPKKSAGHRQQVALLLLIGVVTFLHSACF